MIQLRISAVRNHQFQVLPLIGILSFFMYPFQIPEITCKKIKGRKSIPVLSSILIIIMLLSTFVFGLDIQIDSFDDFVATGWSDAYGTGLLIQSTDPCEHHEGTGAMQLKFEDRTPPGSIAPHKVFSSPLDLTPITENALTLWVWSDLVGSSQLQQIIIYSPGSGPSRFSVPPPTQPGWRKVVAPIDEFVEDSPGTVDYSNINYIQIWCHNWPDGGNSIYLDDFRCETIPETQINISRVEEMPNIPSPYKMKNWKQVATDYDSFVFDFGATGQYLPLIWWDTSHINVSWDVFGMKSYVGDHRSGSGHEGITCMGAVLGATLAGIDKSSQFGHNFVRDAEAYYNIASGQNMVLNLVYTGAGDWWYEVFPHILFYSLVYYYPGTGNMETIMLNTADVWYDACVVMGGNTNPWTVPNFDHTYFDFTTMQPVDINVGSYEWREPGAAGGIAWLEYMAWKKSGDPKYFTAAEWGIEFLHNRDEDKNPYYEVMLPYGAYLAARMNAEHGKNYDIDKIINWCFNPSYNRPGFGVITDNWGGYDVHGLVGGINWYAFAMNTYVQVGAMIPIARYDQRYARALGKWTLNAANAARLFYPDELPDDHQSNPEWDGDPCAVIAYEGLRSEVDGKSPYATGDAMGWGMPTNFGLYGSSYVGFLGGILSTTNVEKILQLDLLKTDFYHDAAYPTYLYYNPYNTEQTVNINVGSNPVDIYDTVSKSFLATNVTNDVNFPIPADSAVVIVLAPAGATITQIGNKKQINGVVVDYRANESYRSCSEVQASPYRLRGDLNGDCEVNMSDLKVLAESWLDEEGLSGWNDLNDDGIVDLGDFAELASTWGKCNNPEKGSPCMPNW